MTEMETKHENCLRYGKGDDGKGKERLLLFFFCLESVDDDNSV